MTTVDPTLVVGQIQALSSTLSGLGPALQQAAPTGSFSSVLDAVQQEMASIGRPPTAVGGTGSSPFVSTAGLLGGVGSSTAGAAGGPSGSQVVAEARQFVGVPYQWGGTSPNTGFDCSGLVQYVYGQLGVSLPRTSQQQATVGTPVASLADARPGDLVFFEPSASGPGHVGIYIGNGQMIDAPHTGTDVQVQSVGQPCAIRRVLPAGGGAQALAMGAGGVPPSLGVPGGLLPLFEQAGARYGVSPALLAAVAKQESGFNPSAVSPAGAQGLMQLMPSTAAGLGVDPTNPQQAVDGAAQLLSGYLQQYNGSVPLALAAYNAGPGAVAQYGGVPPYAETQAYVTDILSSLGVAP